MNAQQDQAAIVAAIESINTQYEILRTFGPSTPAERAETVLNTLATDARTLAYASARLFVLIGATRQKLERQQRDRPIR